MRSDDAFVRAILAEPQDDLLRLAYADWLEEAGDIVRAAYLRLLTQVSGTSPPVEDQVPALLLQLDELRAAVAPAWMGLMHRGRTLPVAPPAGPSDANASLVRFARMSQRPFNPAEIGTFLQQYSRKGCNDRTYSRKVEKRVKRMKPEDLDRLIRGEEDERSGGRGSGETPDAAS